MLQRVCMNIVIVEW